MTHRLLRYANHAISHVLIASATITFPSVVSAAPLRFAALGDLPYKPAERERAPDWLTSIAATQPAFLLHVGDFKAAREPCSDALFNDRLALFNAVPQAFFYTPGDNEWSDCGKPAAGGFDPLERLDRLRQLFFSKPRSLGGAPYPVTQQNKAPENLRWSWSEVLFATLNVPAMNNYGEKRHPSAEFRARNPRNIAWLREAFRQAHEQNAPAIVIAFQANPGFGFFGRGTRQDNFDALLTALAEESERFARPVLVIHGDTHSYRFDQPLRSPQTHHIIANVWRLEVPGSPFNGWVEVVLEPASEQQPVQVELKRLE